MHSRSKVVLWSFRENDIQLDSPEDRRRAMMRRSYQRFLRLMRERMVESQKQMRKLGVSAAEATRRMREVGRYLNKR